MLGVERVMQAGPRTPREARELARELNDAERRRRALREDEHARRLEAIRKGNPAAADRPRINAAEVYRRRAVRGELSEEERQKVTEARDRLNEVLAPPPAPAEPDQGDAGAPGAHGRRGPRVATAAVYARRRSIRGELPAERAAACAASCRVHDDGQREEPCSASCQLRDVLECGDEPAGRLDMAAVYARRRRSVPSGGAPAAPTPPRSFADLSRSYYGGGQSDRLGVIGSSSRGGAR